MLSDVAIVGEDVKDCDAVCERDRINDALPVAEPIQVRVALADFVFDSERLVEVVDVTDRVALLERDCVPVLDATADEDVDSVALVLIDWDMDSLGEVLDVDIADEEGLPVMLIG